ADFERSLATHFWGPLHLTRAALPWLRRAGPGHVINVSSVGGRVGVPHLAPYCAGKFALTGWSQVLRAELAAANIHVTLATPGLMRTGSVRQVQVRGRHRAEAQWFAALSATSLTSKDATAAAREILAAARRGDAGVTPGWQARALIAAQASLPELTAGVMAAVASHLLPAATAAPSPARRVESLDLGWAQRLVSASTAAAYNQL
ncbi:MAG: SDR family NAD(P)-dependent oxidoreductase, partial [Acidobacteria bacterium]|nr:SDR family NAD(P)-dependent oxidoreductase [Acidobacteriota bacterium]